MPTQQEIDDAAALVLADAFADYPLFATALTDRVRRHAALPLLWRDVLGHMRDGGPVTVDLVERDDRTVGAAVWISDAMFDDTLRTVLKGRYLRFAATAGLRPALRLLRIQNGIDALHQRVVTEHHSYLLAIGVLPGWQGQGIASELLQRGLARADERQLPVYLETQSAVNVAVYRHFGFEVPLEHEADGVHTWAMLRPAQR